MSSFVCLSRMVLTVLALSLSLQVQAQSVSTGKLTGVVTNKATAAFLKGALVEIPALSRQTITEANGAFSFDGLPVGEHTVVVSYTGLDSARQTVQIAAGEPAMLEVDLTAAVYQLESFTVLGEREGNAASITAQRNAPNVKNVVALDTFGVLANENPAELLVRLPGVAGTVDDQGTTTQVKVRGVASALSSVTVDGSKMASQGGLSRHFQMNATSAVMFDEVEVIKSPTPDIDADSLGGTVNFKTRSALTMKESRRISYRVGALWAPPFFDRTPTRGEHPIHGLGSMIYQEKFKLGETTKPNLGLVVNTFYSENGRDGEFIRYDYQYTTNSPAYLWDFWTNNIYNNRKQKGVNVKADYQVNDTTRIYVGGTRSTFDTQRQYLQTRATTSRTNYVAATGAGTIFPGYTDDRTQVKAQTASLFEVHSSAVGFYDDQQQFNLGVAHQFARLKLDYDVNYSRSRVSQYDGMQSDEGPGGTFTMQARNIGWILDKSAAELAPSFVQTEGPSIHDAASYTTAQLVKLDAKRDTEVLNLSLAGSYDFTSRIPITVKAGGRFRSQKSSVSSASRTWNYAGPAGSLGTFVDPGIITTYWRDSGMPYPDVGRVGRDVVANPARWQEDLNYAANQRYLGNSGVNEEVTAAFLMAKTRLGKLGALTGIRMEDTQVESRGHIQNAAIPTSNPEGRYNNPRTSSGGYTNYFPGVHFTYNFTKGLVARASWSNSIGRPAMSSLVPAETIGNIDGQDTLTVNNPALKPQYSENWDVALEYYFEPIGVFSAGYFRKDITDFLLLDSVGTVGAGPNNGFGGNYENYLLYMNRNGGMARIEGWEFNYQQQLSFLPGVLKHLGVFGNFTYLQTSGNYGNDGVRATNMIAGFVPRSGNVGLNYSHRGIGVSILGNYSGDYLEEYSSDASRLRFKRAGTVVNLNLSYTFSPRLNVFCNFVNLFNAPQEWYRSSEDRTERIIRNGATIYFGINGRL